MRCAGAFRHGQYRLVPGRLPHGRGAGLHALAEARPLLVRQPVVVLDDVHAALGELAGHRRQRACGQAHRFERRHHQGLSRRDAHEPPQAGGAEAGTLEEPQDPGGEEEALHLHAGLEGRVPEDDVQELREVLAGAGVDVGDPHAPLVLPPRAPPAPARGPQPLHPAHDLVRDEPRRHQRRGQLHRLLQADPPRPRHHLVVGGGQEVLHGEPPGGGHRARAPGQHALHGGQPGLAVRRHAPRRSPPPRSSPPPLLWRPGAGDPPGGDLGGQGLAFGRGRPRGSGISLRAGETSGVRD